MVFHQQEIEFDTDILHLLDERPELRFCMLDMLGTIKKAVDDATDEFDYSISLPMKSIFADSLDELFRKGMEIDKVTARFDIREQNWVFSNVPTMFKEYMTQITHQCEGLKDCKSPEEAKNKLLETMKANYGTFAIYDLHDEVIKQELKDTVAEFCVQSSAVQTSSWQSFVSNTANDNTAQRRRP